MLLLLFKFLSLLTASTSVQMSFLVFSERVSKKDQTSAQFGEHWESELDGSLQEFEPSDYIISERLPIEQNHDSTEKDLAESGSDVSRVVTLFIRSFVHRWY